MSTAAHNLSAYKPESLPDATDMKFAIVVSEWNEEITGAMLEGAISTLRERGVDPENIIVETVPGSYELVYAASMFAYFSDIDSDDDVDAVIALGCVIRGETPHFDYICQGVANGLAHLNADADVPVIFGLLTTENMEQARERAGGRLGNKGVECAVTAIKMADFACRNRI